MCNCCNEACIVLNASLRHGSLRDSFAKTRYQAIVDEKSCVGCQTCLERCPFDALSMEKPPGSKKYKARVNNEKCWGCGLCSATSEPSAIWLKAVRPATHIPDDPGSGSLRDEWVGMSECHE
jgi:heterodisulfide reductase subunit A-like polyferredoxin